MAADRARAGRGVPRARPQAGPRARLCILFRSGGDWGVRQRDVTSVSKDVKTSIKTQMRLCVLFQ